jgi:carotenoid 1,2-hydratase
MIGLVTSETPTPPAILAEAGAFCWWYLDLVDARGDGLVLIWSYGLPFLPGLASAARAGRPVRPGERPSVNLATYRRGMLDSYVLHELDPADCSFGGAAQWMGDSHFRADELPGGRRRLEVRLDLPLPATDARLHGRIEVEGPRVELPADALGAADARHAWGPILTGAPARARLFLGERPVLALDAPAYHDRNWSRAPLHELGIARWRWARLDLPGQRLAWYQLDPDDGAAKRSILVQTRDDGRTRVFEDVPYRLRQPLLNPFLLGWHRRVEVDATALGGPAFHFTQNLPVDSGPFYLRFLPRARDAEGRPGVGVSELVAPHRVDQAILRPMVRLRVSSARPGSWLQPLFTGPLRSRPGRFLGQLLRPRLLLPRLLS